MAGATATDDSWSASSVFMLLGALFAAAGVGGPVYFLHSRSAPAGATAATSLEIGDQPTDQADDVKSVRVIRDAFANQPARPESPRRVSEPTANARLPRVALGGSKAVDERQSHQQSRRQLKAEIKRLRGDWPDIELTFLIASLPDPIDSHFPLYFDTQLAAIQWALQGYEYIPDRYDLPWQTWFQNRADKLAPPRRYRTRPGTLFFRNASQYNAAPKPDPKCPPLDPKQPPPATKPGVKFLALLVVGETPTAGVDKVALAACLDLIDLWELTAKPQPATTASKPLEISIIGPTFSGSSYSLAQCVKTWYKDRGTKLSTRSPVRFAICTGSANAPENSRILRSASEPVCQFSTTIIDANVALDHILDYLSLRIPRDKIALLYEAGTGYGASFRSSAELERNTHYKLVELTYPLQIGRLRNEYDKARQLIAPSAPSTPDVRPKLDFSFDRTPFAIDSLPVFSREAAVLAERQLAATLSTISRRDIRAVGIIGSDVNDVLFLAEQVRLYAPDVQLFALGADLLYATPEYLHYTAGMLIASTYPLFPNNHVWCGQDREDLLPFPNDLSVGVFNATRALMNRRDRHCNSSGQLQPLYEFREPLDKDSRLPPLWLTMVGHDGLWPVRTWKLGKLEQQEFHCIDAPEAAVAGTVTTFPTGVNGFIVGGLALVCVGLLFRCNQRGFWRSRGWASRLRPTTGRLWAAFAPLPSTFEPGPAQSSKRTLVYRVRWDAFGPAMALFFGLMSVLVCFAAPAWSIALLGYQPEDLRSQASWWTVLTVTAAGAFTLLVALVRLSLQCMRECPRHLPRAIQRHRTLIFAGVELFLGLATVVFVLLWVRTFFWLRSSENPVLDTAIFAERWGTYSSGVSPIVSTALLGTIIALWGLCHLRRLHLLSFYRPDIPLEQPEGSEVAAGIASRVDDIEATLQPTLFLPSELPECVFLLAVSIGAVYLFLIRWNRTAENRIFNWYFILTAGLAIAAIALLQVQFMAATRSLRRCLRRLSQHPMVEAFKNVPQPLGAKAGAAFFSTRPHPGELERSVRLLTQLEASLASDRGFTTKQKKRLHAHSDEARELLADVLAVKSTEQLRVFAVGTLLSDALAQAGRIFAARLGNYWSDRDVMEPPANPPANQPTVSAPPAWQSDAELFIVLQFTSLIRQMFAQLRNLLTFLVAMVLLLLWALNSYPFQPHRLIVVFSYALVLWCAGTVLIAVVDFNRDEVLSNLTRTTPNRLTLDRTVVVPVLTYVVIPLLSLAAVQFPEISDSAFSWIGFVQRALHG